MISSLETTREMDKNEISMSRGIKIIHYCRENYIETRLVSSNGLYQYIIDTSKLTPEQIQYINNIQNGK